MVARLHQMKKKSDSIHQLVTSVMSIEVPPEGQLVNPFKPVRKTNKQVTLDELINKRGPVELPKDVSTWTSKNFATHFARSYHDHLGGNYKITFTSDLPIIKNIGDFFDSNGLNRNEWTKKLFDWSFNNYDQIVKKFNYFTLLSVFNSINYFYQDEVLPQVESGSIERNSQDNSLLDEIESLQANKVKPTEIFARFGIPITVTYLNKVKGYDIEKIVNSLNVRFADNKSTDIEILERIFNSSIINSPYPEEFLMLNWRSEFKSLTNFYRTESWWRDKDYSGKPLDKYFTLLMGGK